MVDTVTIQPVTLPQRPNLLNYLWSHRKRLVVGGISGLVIGVVIALIIPKTYTSSATVMFPSAPMSAMSMLSGGGGNDLPSLPVLGGAMMVPQPGTSADTASVLLKSHRVERDVIRDLELQKVWHLRKEIDVYKRFERGLQCQIGKSGELNLGYRDWSKELSLQIANKLVDELSVLSEELGMDPATRSFKFLKSQVGISQARVQKAQHNMMVFQREHGIIDIVEQAKALADQYVKLESDLTTAKIEANAAVRQVNMMANTAGRLIQSCMDPVPGPSNTLSPLYQKASDLEAQLVLLRDKMTADHPDVKNKENELNVAQRQLKLEIQRQLSLLKNGSTPGVSDAVVQAAVAQAKATGQQMALQEMQQAVAKLPQQQGNFLHLQAELDASIEALKLYREELEKSRIMMETRSPVFEVIDHPDLPIGPDKSGRSIIALLLFLLCTGVACAWPLREWHQAQERELTAASAGGGVTQLQ